MGFQAEDELPVNEDLLKMLQDLGNPEGGLMSSLQIDKFAQEMFQQFEAEPSLSLMSLDPQN